MEVVTGQVTMQLGNWITLASTLILLTGIIVSLYLGTKSIHLTRTSQIREHRIRLLKEVIDWVIDVDTCGLSDTTAFEMSKEKNEVTRLRMLYASTVELELAFIAKMKKGAYILRIAALFDVGLERSISKLIDDIDTHINNLRIQMEAIQKVINKYDYDTRISFLSVLDTSNDHIRDMENSIENVLHLASSIQGKEIS